MGCIGGLFLFAAIGLLGLGIVGLVIGLCTLAWEAALASLGFVAAGLVLGAIASAILE